MECLPLNDAFTHWLMQYGSIVLFVFLILGIIALPIPDETLLIFAGIFMYDGKLLIAPTLIAAYAGSICGITISYCVGATIGYYLVHKYGQWVGITDKRIEQAEAWFQKYGRWTLTIGYFIPGIRHLTGLTTGMAKVKYHDFAIFAYTGAFIWVTFFLSIGYFFGNHCLAIFHGLEIGVDDIIIGVLLIIFLYFSIKAFKKKF